MSTLSGTYSLFSGSVINIDRLTSLLGIITAEPREDGFFLGLLCFLLLFVVWRNMRVRVLVLVVGFRFADAGDLRARKLLYSSHLGRS